MAGACAVGACGPGRRQWLAPAGAPVPRYCSLAWRLLQSALGGNGFGCDMAHLQQMEFCQLVKRALPLFFFEVFVLDIGSLDIDGNNRYLFDDALYLGVDLAPGPNVDIVSKGHELRMPDGTFDVIVSTECFEHDRHYPETLRNICRMLKPGGLFLFTCATEGRHEHGTRRTTPQDAPLLGAHGDWQDYYRNLTERDIRNAIDVDDLFPSHDFTVNPVSHDLYFWGVKKGVLTRRRDYSFQLPAMSTRVAVAGARRDPRGGEADRRDDATGPSPATGRALPWLQPGSRSGTAREIVEILTPFDSSEAVQRLKVDPLVKLKGTEFDFRRFGSGGEATASVVINGLNIDFDRNPSLFNVLQTRARTALIMLFFADVGAPALRALRTLSSVVDVFLVPTPEMRDFVRTFTHRPVEILFDPIDFCLHESLAKEPPDEGLKVVWFGYPESYGRSMAEYQQCLMSLHQSGEIDYHIVTKNERYGRTPSCVLHEYVWDCFPALLETFDVCVASHAPFDFTVSSLWKSENKAVLAINRGLAVVASRTPAYTRLLARCGLEEYLFSAPAELIGLLRRLRSPAERRRYLSLSQRAVLEHYAASRMADDWVQLYRASRARKFPRQQAPLPVLPVR